MGKTFLGKVTIITGASAGIGKATAVHFAKLGSSLVLAGRRADKLEETKTDCIATGLTPDQIVTIAGDICDSFHREKLVNTAIEKFGKIDILVNNAGAPNHGLSMEAYDQVMNTNLRSVIHLTRLAQEHLIASKGSIVNISSVTSLRPFPALAYYCISKAGLDMFTKCVALELAPHGVRVNALNPGGVVTEIRRDIPADTLPERMERLRAAHPIGRIGESEEMATIIAFLAGSDSSFMTGSIVVADGGALLGSATNTTISTVSQPQK